MANEITQAGGQIAAYGGPQVTITGSAIGTAAASIYGLGASGYQLWKSGQAEFLNTLKTLIPGNSYIVKPKAAPMDFPPPTQGGGVTRPPFFIGFHLLATDPLVSTQGQFVENMRGSIAATPVNGVTVSYSLNGGSFVSESAVNNAIAALDPTAIASNAYTIDVQFTRTSADPVDVTVTMSNYY